MHVKVCKFGGSSLADGNNIRRAAEILRADETRRYVVVSAPGKRFSGDVKITDQLYDGYREAAETGSCVNAFAPVRRRFLSIVEELGLELSTSRPFSTNASGRS